MSEDFYRYDVNEVGLSLEFYRLWPVESIVDADSGNIYQRIENNLGLVFLRYGPNETFESFLETLTDAITTVSIVSDVSQTLFEREVRHVILRQERQAIGIHRQRGAGEMPVHEHSPEVHTILSVFCFNHRGIPVLVGYRILEQSLESYRSVLERIVNSVRNSTQGNNV